MGRYTNWIVFEDEAGKPLAIEDDHKGLDKVLTMKGYTILGTPLADKPADAIDYVLSVRR